MSHLKRLMILSGLMLAVLIPCKLFAQSETSIWFKSSDPEFSNRKPIVSDSEYPTTYGGRGNADCSNLTFTRRDGDNIPHSPLHKESQITDCFMYSHIGYVSTNGLLNVGGTDYVAEIVHPDLSPTSFFVFQNSDVFISNATGAPAVGAYVWFDHLLTSTKYQEDSFGRMRAIIDPKSQIALTDRSGTLLPVMADNFAVSDNGEWALVDSPGRAVLRINLDTREVLPFTNSFEFGNGIGASLRLAISSDGRYAALASKNYSYFKIFDLSTCGPTPDKISAPVSGCVSRDLNQFVHTKINDMGTLLNMRFLTDNLIQFYASYNASSNPVIGQFIIAAPGSYLTGMDYLAMGDSYSSGEGAQRYEIGTDVQDINLCHLSTASYPYLIAKKIQANNFHSVACSGATTTNIRGGSGVDRKLIKKDRDNQYNPEKIPQNNSLGDWIPGYKKQISFISINNPTMITLGIGGNDISFADKLTACLKPFTCFPSYEDRVDVFNEIDSKLNIFTETFKKAKDYATKNARLYVVGYPQIANPYGNCGLNVHMNHDELVFGASVINRLNAVIQVAAQQAGVHYINVEDAFEGHRLCEGLSGKTAVNGLTTGNDKLGIIGNESYHPTKYGHELLADKILGLTNNLGMDNPSPNIAAKLPKITETDASLKNTIKTGRTPKKKIPLKTSVKTVKKTKKSTITLKATDYNLTPGTSLAVSIDNNPVATVITDENGNANIDITIPADGSTGPSTIDVTGTDVTGQQIDIGTVITIGNDGADFDGDGINDNLDSCPMIINSLIDFDQDGIDDACDGVIGDAPILVTTTTQQNNNSSTTVTESAEPNGGQSTISVSGDIRQPSAGSAILASDQTPPTSSGKVLSSSNKLTAPLQNSANKIKNLLDKSASKHPVKLIVLLVSLIISLIIMLGWHMGKKQEKYLLA